MPVINYTDDDGTLRWSLIPDMIDDIRSGYLAPAAGDERKPNRPSYGMVNPFDIGPGPSTRSDQFRHDSDDDEPDEQAEARQSLFESLSKLHDIVTDHTTYGSSRSSSEAETLYRLSRFAPIVSRASDRYAAHDPNYRHYHEDIVAICDAIQRANRSANLDGSTTQSAGKTESPSPESLVEMLREARNETEAALSNGPGMLPSGSIPMHPNCQQDPTDAEVEQAVEDAEVDVDAIVRELESGLPVDVDPEVIEQELQAARENTGFDRDSDSPLTSISGVSHLKVEALQAAGYTTIEDVQRASQAELSEVEGIGNALAARMKADVGDHDDPF